MKELVNMDVRKETLFKFIQGTSTQPNTPHNNIIISGRGGSGKTLLAINMMKEHHKNGGAFCYINTCNHKEAKDYIKEFSKDVSIVSSVHNEQYIRSSIISFIDGTKSLLIEPVSDFGKDSFLDFVMKTIFEICVNTYFDLSQSPKKLLIIDDADNFKDMFLSNISRVTRRANVTNIIILKNIDEHIESIEQASIQVLFADSPQSSKKWSDVLGFPIHHSEIPKFHAMVNR